MELKSPAFEHEGQIPSRHTCDGEDVSPALEISGVPPGTAALALVMDDPDAPGGTFDHWLVWNIPPRTAAIPEGTEPEGIEGRTDFGKQGYGGPCLPGGTHRYRLKLYALDETLALKAGSRKAQLEEAMEGHIIEQTLLQGSYTRKR